VGLWSAEATGAGPWSWCRGSDGCGPRSWYGGSGGRGPWELVSPKRRARAPEVVVEADVTGGAVAIGEDEADGPGTGAVTSPAGAQVPRMPTLAAMIPTSATAPHD